MSRRARLGLAVSFAVLASLIALAAVGAQSGSVEARIAARKAADGRVELCLQLGAEKEPRCPVERYFPYPDATVDRWLQSSPLTVDDASLRVRARRDDGPWIELALIVALDGETNILTPQRRFFNWETAETGRWLRSSWVSMDTISASSALGVAENAARLQVERRAPEFTLPRLENEGLISLSDYRGKTVVLAFWASWSAGDRELLNRLDALWRAQGGSQGDLAVLAINVYDTPGAASRAFVQAGVGFPGLIDAQAAVTRHYRVDGLPELLLIDAGGVYRERLTGAADTAAIQAAIRRTAQAGGELP